VVTLLSSGTAAKLTATPYSYLEVGATASVMPRCYSHLEESVALQASSFDAAAERLMTWQVHEDAGIHVAASSRRVQPDDVVEMFLGPQWLRVRAICRIAYVVDEPDRAGFGYGTLHGHPESGEEAFLVERADGAARFTIRAFSKPATRLARYGGPFTSRVQARITQRYLRAIHPRP
jgi:uncharacterized protein (UPF0548 family)